MEKSIAPACVKPSLPVTLRPVESPELLRLVAGWLNDPGNAQWLDFGDGRQSVTPEWLRIATQRRLLVLRVFEGDDGAPAGAAGLGNINPHFRSATLWTVLGDKRLARHGYATRATRSMLTLGFEELRLHSINTWIVEHNPSVGVARNVGFRPAGRQRQCHVIDGLVYDRLWFDILATEHAEQRHALQF
jgi:RimJ/RimL family protein N-acetyltransferase